MGSNLRTIGVQTCSLLHSIGIQYESVGIQYESPPHSLTVDNSASTSTDSSIATAPPPPPSSPMPQITTVFSVEDEELDIKPEVDIDPTAALIEEHDLEYTWKKDHHQS